MVKERFIPWAAYCCYSKIDLDVYNNDTTSNLSFTLDKLIALMLVELRDT